MSLSLSLNIYIYIYTYSNIYRYTCDIRYGVIIFCQLIRPAAEPQRQGVAGSRGAAEGPRGKGLPSRTYHAMTYYIYYAMIHYTMILYNTMSHNTTQHHIIEYIILLIHIIHNII